MKATPFLHIPNTSLGEGPVWDYRTQQFWWVDIPNGILHCHDYQSAKNKSYQMGQMLGSVVPCENGDLILSMQHGFVFFNPETEKLAPITDPEAHLPDNRFNDGKCDPAGRFWSGTMRINRPRLPTGSFYCLDNKLEVSKKLSNIIVSNGLAWNKAADKMYYIDTHTLKVQAFHYDLATGDIEKEKDALVFEGIFPDGMCIDENDNLWIAFFRSGKVICFNPETGEKLEEIEVPASKTTSCAFGGEDLDTLFITSAANEGEPLGGAIFSIKPGVRGLKANFFKQN